MKKNVLVVFFALLLAPLVPKVPPQLFKIADFCAVLFELSAFFFLLAGRTGWRIWLLVAAGFQLTNALLLNISFHIQVLVYLPFVALARFSGRPNLGGSKAIPWWSVPLIIAAIILGVAHTAQRLNGGGSQFLFIEGGSVVRLPLYGSLVLLALCAVVIAIDLATCACGARLHYARSRRGVP